MIGRLGHVAIAVPDLGAAVALYGELLGGEVGEVMQLPEHGVRVAFVSLPNAQVELMAPLGDGSPVAGFLERHPEGGLHHVCYEVADIDAAVEALTAAGARVLGDGRPRTGAHGRPVVFLHPKDFCGTLVELEEVKPELLPG